MNVESYRRRLLELEQTLSATIVGDRDAARLQVSDEPGDVGDASVADESESEDFTEAELNAATLQQVRDAVRRIDEGTFGRCAADGGPIEEARLEAVPWTPYCLKHAQRREREVAVRTPTL